MKYTHLHHGCTGDDTCPHCANMEKPGYEAVRANLLLPEHKHLAAPLPRTAPCRHLGAGTGARVECGTCPQNRTTLKLFTCAVHGQCVLGPQTAPGVACCGTCKDYVAKAPPPLVPLARPIQRNLLYHIYPLQGGIWRWNVIQLRQRLALFNGRRVVAIATGPETEPASSVRWELGEDEAEYIEVRNVPDRREVQTFRPLWERMRDQPGVTLYAHAKGVTRQPGSTAAEWAAILYRACMDYWPAVEGLLEAHPLAGPFKRHVKGWADLSSTWHYSGSWYWLRHDALFARPDWQRIDQHWSGIEAWPSLHFEAQEAGAIFYEWHGHGLGLYDRKYLESLVLPAWERWQADHAHQQTEGLS